MSWLGTQTWSWREVPGATAYRIYWRSPSGVFCSTKRVEYPASVCVDGVCQGEARPPAMPLAFVVVVAVNAAGQSVTEHGPVEICP